MIAPLSREHVDRAWEAALARWDVRVQLSPPAPLEEVRDDHWNGREPLAYIDMKTRQVVVNLPLLVTLGAAHALPAVLAHEIGHHVRFPHTLAKIADFTVLERELLPRASRSLLNLFFDLQVNEVVGHDPAMRAGLADVYAASVRSADTPCSALFGFYLAIYELLWGLARGALVGAARFEELEAAHPGFAAEADVFASTFWALADEHLAFVYMIGRFARFLAHDDPSATLPMSADLPLPGADDLVDALRSRGRAARAIHDARERGWLDGDGIATTPASPFGTLAGVMAGRPGGAADIAFRDAVVEGLYRGYVEQHLVPIPTVRGPAPEPALPSTTTDWDAGDGLHSIDWTASVLARGPLAAAAPLRRELLADGEPSAIGERVAVEIYLDTSGSMPSPAAGLNAMTLAALIVGTAATRAGGRVRAVIYSSSHEVSPWLYGEEAARRALLRYQGGGTVFPFARARELAREEPAALRLVISDGDFLYNARAPGAKEALLEVADRSRLLSLVLLLGDGGALAKTELASVLTHPRARLVAVRSATDLPAAAAALSRALFDPPRR